MDEQLQYQCWLDADLNDREDDADALLQTVFKGAMPAAPASTAFTARTMPPAPRGGCPRRGAGRGSTWWVGQHLGAVGGGLCTLLYFSPCSAPSAFSAIVVNALDLLIGAVVDVATTTRVRW